MKKVDAIIIGSGQAARQLCLKLSEAGWKTVLIEKSEEFLGGVCLNIGCTPTKTLIASAKVMHNIENAEKHGISASNFSLNFDKTQQRKDTIISNSKKGLKKRIAAAKNLELVYGEASFSGEKSVIVNLENGRKKELTASHIFINAGTRPAVPKIEGLQNVKYYDSTGMLALKEIPKKLIVVGGGYIGLEIGQMYSRFGSKVTIIESSAQIMSTEDTDVAESLVSILEEDGLQFIVNATVEKVKSDDKKVTLTYSKKGKSHSISGSHLFVATGRTSNADFLKTEKAGINLDKKGFIKVNSTLETAAKGIYALGDINGGPQFTHIAHNDFVIIESNLLKNKKLSTKNRLVPYTMFTDPQLGRIGLTENQAKEQGLDYKVLKIGGDRITRGIETGEQQGIWKAIVEKKSGKILGASIICTEGGEIATVIEMAMMGGLKAQDLSRAIFAHPTFSESLNTLFTEYFK